MARRSTCQDAPKRYQGLDFGKSSTGGTPPALALSSGTTSPPFPIQQGIRQGGVLSPFLYCLFVDELLDILTNSGLAGTNRVQSKEGTSR